MGLGMMVALFTVFLSLNQNIKRGQYSTVTKGKTRKKYILMSRIPIR
jgi:hypothetical protein